jgi:CxxC motif-containing protein
VLTETQSVAANQCPKEKEYHAKEIRINESAQLEVILYTSALEN